MVDTRRAGVTALGVWLLAAVSAGAVAAGGPGPDQLSLDEATRARCVEILRAGFASDEFWPSMHAAEGLSVAGLGAEVRRALAPKLPGEKDLQHRCGLAREITRAGDLSACQTLLEVLADPDPYGHVHACESLYKVWQIGDGALLRRALAKEGSPKLTVMAAAALARWGGPQAMARLREVLKAEDGETARLAAWVLARVGGPEDLPALRAGQAKLADPLTRAYFTHALASLGDADARAELVKNLDHEDFNVRVYAAEFAPEARALAARDALVKRLEDPVLDVRIRAADALLRLAAPAPLDRRAVVERDVFRATAGNPRYSEGSVLALRDGRLFYATTEFIGSGSDFAKGRVIAVESADEGRTWSAPKVLQENVGRQNVMSVTLRRLTGKNPFDGPIGFFFLVKNSYSDLVVDLRTSTDEAHMFGPAVRVSAEPGYHVMNNDRVTRLSSGRLIAPVASTSDVVKDGRFVCACYLSDDAGKTWRRSKNTIAYPRRGAMEPEVLEMDGGKLLMHIRTQVGHIAVSESADGGETWGEAKSWGVRGPESPATLRRIPSTGDLLLVWNDTFRAGEGHGGKRTPLTAAVSTDEGRTWAFRRDVETDANHTYAYTSILFHRGRAALTYYVRDEASGRIGSRFRSLPLGWFYESKP
ncbi:MAG: exo-alpha-sialidase [Isosphaeraceae bacterium]